MNHTDSFESCGVRIDAIPIEEAVELILDGQARGAVHLCNSYTLSLACSDAGLSAVLNNGRLNLPDGKPLIWVARWLGLRHMARRVYGPELMQRALEGGQPRHTRHFLYGSTPDVLGTLTASISRSWPEALIVGSLSPPFGQLSDVELDAAITAIESAQSDVVWLGLGTPKQDLVADQLAGRSSSTTFVAIGAAFDFIAGTKRQAPHWMREHGLEWAFRLASEPRRLWKRYLVGNSVFLYRNLRQRPRRVASMPERSDPA